MPEAEGSIAEFLVKQAAGALVGQAATQLIGTPLLNAIGMGQSDNSAAYVAQVTAAIDAIGDKLQQQIDVVQTGIANVAALSLQIEDNQAIKGLSDILQQFNIDAVAIDNVFSEFQNDISYISATNTKKTAEALADLYARLTPNNDTNIANAMADIHNLVVPTSGTTGIFDYLCEVVAQKVLDGAQKAMTTAVPNPPSDWTSQYTLPDDMTYYQAKPGVDQAPETVAAEMPTVIAVMKNVLAAQVKGLLLLTRAWTDGPQEGSLKTHTSNILAEIAAMKAFYPACCKAVDGAINSALKQFGTHLQGTVTQIWHGAPQGLDTSWIIWSVGLGPANVTGSSDDNTFHDDQCVMFATIVQQPWLRQRNNGYSIMTQGHLNTPAQYVLAQLWNWYSDGQAEGDGEVLPAFNAPAPAALTALLAGLPSNEAELQAQMAAAVPPPPPPPPRPKTPEELRLEAIDRAAREAEDAISRATENIP